MKKTTVQDTVTEYLEQFNRRGFLYVPSQPGDSRKIKAMQKKAIEILSFQDDLGVLAESVRTRGEADSIRDSIRDTISKMQRKSNEEYLIANDYFAFLNQKCILRRRAATGAFASGHPALPAAGVNRPLYVQS